MYPSATRHHDWRSQQKFSEGAARAVAQAWYGNSAFSRCDWMHTFRACSDALRAAYVKKSPIASNWLDSYELWLWLSISWENRNLTKEDFLCMARAFPFFSFLIAPRAWKILPMSSSRRSMIRPSLANQVTGLLWRDDRMQRRNVHCNVLTKKKTKTGTHQGSETRCRKSLPR